MRGYRNKTHIALHIAARTVIGGDGQQTRIFALRAGIGLHRHRIVSGYFTKLV